ncbi:unnamed protein product [Hymenolepis diminuta]|uniref:Uncharacterized protein n=1 Tax=Hymenolepis diminuta TaxID=6216 RepID=A0A564XYM4_HYMDI|nr:unnamed protein product [Hymenolepis diminuta]
MVLQLSMQSINSHALSMTQRPFFDFGLCFNSPDSLRFQMPMFGGTQNTCITSSQSSFISDSFREAVDLTISANAPPQSIATQPTFSMPQNAPVMTFNSANPIYPPFIPKHLTDIFMQPFPNASEPRSLDEGICGSMFLILLCQF